ncbi:metal-dependent hydrolase [Chengkuizengella axinellae]|uniref:Metal-dependent hydrolase n=1 Tax=Chengkuizengella axinellae TaxID=3064388 RepID=A0ABT9IYS6_9BACL|nr:metal-dependent hydrolase [Chengkuizengella sp. 2205SS18-9]MDP5274524.1 metal-dependent hydrolase [Chengkuizengella sp. 2205SS18-9]
MEYLTWFILTVISEVGYHGAVGASVSYLFLRKKVTSHKVWFVLLFGILAAVISDIPVVVSIPLINNVILYEFMHSLFVAPILSLGLAFAARLFLNEIKFSLLWSSLFLSLMIGHFLMDFLDNGLPLFYPIIESREIGINILTGNDILIIVPFLLLLPSLLFLHQDQRKQLELIAIILVITLVTSYIGFRGYSKLQIYQELVEEYPYSNVEILLEPESSNPLSDRQWTYSINTGQLSIGGVASLSKIVELERSFRTNKGPMLLLEQVIIKDELYLIGTQYYFDSDYINVTLNGEREIAYEELFIFQTHKQYLRVEQVDEDKKEEILKESSLKYTRNLSCNTLFQTHQGKEAESVSLIRRG